jgi:hypothetical protein
LQDIELQAISQEVMERFYNLLAVARATDSVECPANRPDATATHGSTPELLLARSMAHDVGLGNVSDDASVLGSFLRRRFLLRPKLHGRDASVGTIAPVG